LATLLAVKTTAAGLVAALAVACGAAMGTLACEPPEARVPNPSRQLDERRAVEVIRKAIHAEGAEPAPGRDVTLVTGSPLHIDVSVEGHAYGVAYITTEDAEKSGAAIPPPNKKDERLRIVRGGPDGETRVVLLYQANYVFDDLVGEGHEQTTITCESQLTRDVQDFITHAQSQKYK
jgi:hypothetical protein